MADKSRLFGVPAKNSKPKRLSSVTGTASRKTSTSASTAKERPVSRPNVTIRQESALPEFDAEIAYGKFLRTMLEDCLVDEKIEREETAMDIQMAQLADRFKKTMAQLDKTNRRLKDISFVVEQKRLLELKSQDCTKFYDLTDESNVQDIVGKLSATEQSYLDRLQTKNVDFGYNKESGHKQLLDAVNEAIDGLEQIKKHSNLDLQKFEEYAKLETDLRELETSKFDLESLKSEFEAKFPRFSEKLLKDVSDKIAAMMKSDDKDDDVNDIEDDDDVNDIDDA